MLLVVGGHSRNIGKSSVVEGLVRAIPRAQWTAIKITQHGHGVCSAGGNSCECSGGSDHPFAISQEIEPNGSDSGRFLAAGAARSYWVRTAMGQLGNAVPELKRLIASAPNTIVESNTLLDYFVPGLYLAVLDYRVSDMKDSARRFLSRADALVEAGERPLELPWSGVPLRWLEGKPRFAAKPPAYVEPALVEFVEARLGAAPTSAPGPSSPRLSA